MKKQREEDLKDDLSNYDSSSFEKPSVTVDICICRIIGNDLKVLLIKRKYPPFRDFWAIPGGFVEVLKKESLEEAARRELFEETGIKQSVYLEQLLTAGNPDRDPRTRVISVVYYSLIPFDFPFNEQQVKAADDAKEYQWYSLRALPCLAFDHRDILEALLKRIMEKVLTTNLAFRLVPEHFTWKELQTVFEIVLEQDIADGNFRRKIKRQFIIGELNKTKKTKGREAKLLKYCGTHKLI